MTLDAFFREQELSRQIFETVKLAVEGIGPAALRISKSQVAFRNPKVFALVWMPGQYLRRKAAPLVLTLSFRHRDDSPRWKEIVQPSPGRFTHHLELYAPEDVDDEVTAWLRAAWQSALDK
jgi:hypothetical protein